MKSKEEVLQHLAECGYNDYSHDRIFGFLCGKGYITPVDTDIKLLFGDNTFDDFYTWYYSPDELSVFKELFDDICERATHCKTLSEIERYIKQIDLLASIGSKQFNIKE